MTKIDQYIQSLLVQNDWEAFLEHNSGLPGPRANLELAHAAARVGSAAQFESWLDNHPERAPENTPRVFLMVCGVLGLGELLAKGETEHLRMLRSLANDPRWRVREAVAMALQRWGQTELPVLYQTMRNWVSGEQPGSLLECRAAAAALCEPALLVDPDHAAGVIALLDEITAILLKTQDRHSEPFRVLRKGLAYCWSVAIAANPPVGKAHFEAWFAHPDPDLQWLLRENLQKARLNRMDPNWVASCLTMLEGGSDL